MFGGGKAGALAAILSGLLVAYFLVPPVGSFAFTWRSDWIGMATFAAGAALIIQVVDVAVRSSERLADTTDELRALNETLDIRIAKRTHELTMFAASLRDEIKTREAAETLARQMQKMEAVGQLTGGIAHDFNNMLSIITGSLEMLERRLLEGRDVMLYVDNAKDGARRAATLTAQLLVFSRKQALAPAVIDVNALVATMAELLRRTLGDNIAFECVLAGGLWRTCVDPGQLENAIVNLAVNARDAMPSGGKLTIETLNASLDDNYALSHGDVAAGQYVLVAVSDTGTGMDPKIAARAFDPFFTTKPEGQGTGLGLSQVHGFIKQSRGHIKIYSEVGQGTTIKIYLPRHVGAAARCHNDRQAPAESPMPPGSADEVILVVEDDDDVRRTHVSMLKEINYGILQAASGDEAMDVLRDRRDIALLFTDVMMPGMTGWALAEQARLLLPNLKVLYTTGYTPGAIVHNGVVDAGVDLLPKPIALDQLARKVRAILDRC